MRKLALALAFAGLLLSAAATAAADHAAFIKGPFKTGPEVTKQCLQCHQS